MVNDHWSCVSSGDGYDTYVGYFGDADIDGDEGGGRGGGVDWNSAKSLVGGCGYKASLFSTKAMKEPIPGSRNPLLKLNHMKKRKKLC